MDHSRKLIVRIWKVGRPIKDRLQRLEGRANEINFENLVLQEFCRNVVDDEITTR